MDREGGFIVIHRRIESWPLWPRLRADQRWVVAQLILMANWKDTTVWTLRGEEIAVKRGQLIASEHTIADRANSSRQVVRTVFALLEREGFLTRAPAISNPDPNQANARTPYLVTVTNYNRFQTLQDDGGGWSNQGANQRPTKGQPRANQGPTRSEPVEPVEPVEPPTSRPVTPVAEVVAHWRTVAWPKLSSRPCPESKSDFGVVGRLLKNGVTVADAKAAMDRAVADEWWRDKLDLPTFCAKYARFVPRNEAAPKGYSAVGHVGDFTKEEDTVW